MQPQDNQRKLRLIRPSTIKQNLRPLVQNTKKKLAQTLYYQNSNHNSPLIRENKPPVHQRLGVKQIRLRRPIPLGTNTTNILPKRRLLRYPKIENRFKQNKMQRMYSAQARLERIRSQHGNNGKIKLRRLHRGVASSSNFTVEVKNPSYIPGINGVGPTFGDSYIFKMTLDPDIQAQISDIQKDRSDLDELPALMKITPVTTLIKISDRFAML